MRSLNENMDLSTLSGKPLLPRHKILGLWLFSLCQLSYLFPLRCHYKLPSVFSRNRALNWQAAYRSEPGCLAGSNRNHTNPPVFRKSHWWRRARQQGRVPGRVAPGQRELGWGGRPGVRTWRLLILALLLALPGDTGLVSQAHFAPL